MDTSFPFAATIRHSSGLSKGRFLNGSLLYTVSEIKVTRIYKSSYSNTMKNTTTVHARINKVYWMFKISPSSFHCLLIRMLFFRFNRICLMFSLRVFGWLVVLGLTAL